MLKNENIICVSPIDWDFHWQTPQQIALHLAENDNNVLFIENTGVRVPYFRDIPRIKQRICNWVKSTKGFRQIKKRLYIFSPIILPLTCSRIFRPINRFLFLTAIKRWCKITGFHNPIIITFLPTYISLDLIDEIDHKSLIYYCADNFSSMATNPKQLRKIESMLIKKADLVFATSQGLKDNCQKYRNDVYLFPYGVNLSLFKSFQESGYVIPQDLKSIPGPIVGFVGTIKKHMDFELIKHIVKDNPNVSFVFVGGSELNLANLKFGKNMYFLGKKEHKEIPSYVYNFDISIIPYSVNDYTKFVSPGKIYEYIYAGKPIISTALPSMVEIKKRCPGAVNVIYNKEEFSVAIKNILKSQETIIQSELDAKLSNQRNFAEKYSYEKMFPKMFALIEQDISYRKNMIQSDWKERIKYLYSSIKRKSIGLVVGLVSMYMLIFYTPFPWLVGGVLEKTDIPKPADVIVVFAGGVGESGKANQGHEERVQRAVELYKKGLAEHIIFSSGFVYLFEEPQIMKTLAVYLGVPEDVIILETKARNTYENVKFTYAILENEGWDSALLVSSSYHMKRASLVFNKLAPELEISYLPVVNSKFYEHKSFGNGKMIDIKQLKAILHEYLGIVYYWWKGYI